MSTGSLSWSPLLLVVEPSCTFFLSRGGRSEYMKTTTSWRRIHIKHMNSCRRRNMSVSSSLVRGKKMPRRSNYYILVLTPGEVYLLTTKGPSWKLHSLRKMLNAGPAPTTKMNGQAFRMLVIFHALRMQIQSIVHHNISNDQQEAEEHWPIRRPACRHAITAANTVARSSGAVLLVRKPKIDEPAPVPIPEEKKIIINWSSAH